MDGSARLGSRATIGRIAGGLVAGALVTGLLAAPVGAQEEVDLEAWKALLFEGGEFTTDPNYKGVNEGGTIGTMNVGNFPDEPLPWLSIMASKPWKIGYSIFNSAWPLPVAFAERGRLDGECFGVDVHTYENEADAAKGLQNAELMVQEGIEFAVNLQIYPDVNDQIAQMFDDEGIGQMFYAVPPQTIKKPFIDLPNYSTAYDLGVRLGEHARDDWDGQVDLVLLVGQEQAGAISGQRLDAGLAGIESVLGDIPDDKVATVDSGTGTLEEARQAVADFITSRPDVTYILLPGFADVHSVGADPRSRGGGQGRVRRGLGAAGHARGPRRAAKGTRPERLQGELGPGPRLRQLAGGPGHVRSRGRRAARRERLQGRPHDRGERGLAAVPVERRLQLRAGLTPSRS